MAERTRCPFYGFHFVPEFKSLMHSGGNQCALVIASYSPCRMEMESLPPDWWNCPMNPFAEATIHVADSRDRPLMAMPFRTWFEERTKS